MRRAVEMALLALFWAAIAGAQVGPKVTVVTLKGEVIEGTLEGATATNVTLSFAGTRVPIALDGLRYISFVGRLGAGTAPSGGGAPVSIEDAFAALDQLHAILEVGVLRPQYADRLTEFLPRVNAYLALNEPEFPNVRLALVAAVAAYKTPLGSAEDWQSGADYFRRGRALVEAARRMRADPAERIPPTDHSVRDLPSGTPLSGRLSITDQVETSSTDGYVFDRFTFTPPAAGAFKFLFHAAAGSVGLILRDSDGRLIRRFWPEDGQAFTEALEARPHDLRIFGPAPASYLVAVEQQ